MNTDQGDMSFEELPDKVKVRMLLGRIKALTNKVEALELENKSYIDEVERYVVMDRMISIESLTKKNLAHNAEITKLNRALAIRSERESFWASIKFHHILDEEIMKELEELKEERNTMKELRIKYYEIINNPEFIGLSSKGNKKRRKHQHLLQEVFLKDKGLKEEFLEFIHNNSYEEEDD